jgi:hypothetical protein
MPYSAYWRAMSARPYREELRLSLGVGLEDVAQRDVPVGALLIVQYGVAVAEGAAL